MNTHNLNPVGIVCFFWAVIAFPATSRGEASIWFELSNASPNGGDVSSQGEGRILAIEPDLAPDVSTFQLDMYAHVSTLGLYRVSTSLATDSHTLAVTDVSLDPPLFGTTTPASGTGIFGPGDVALDFGAETATGVGYFGSRVHLGVVTVVIDRTRGYSAIGLIVISARVGTGLFLQSDLQAPEVCYGGGPADSGGVAGNAESPVISFFTPEPSTALLIGFGMLGLVRRRRE